jgi:hypothetical protein
MEKIFIVWSNYDGVNVEDFIDVESAESKLNNIAIAEEKKDYGVRIHRIIKGCELKYHIVERVKRVEITSD